MTWALLIIAIHPSLHTMSTRQAIYAPAAPKPNGNYSHVIRSGDKLYLCGWMGDDPKTGEIVEGDIGAQTVCAYLYVIVVSTENLASTLIASALAPFAH